MHSLGPSAPPPAPTVRQQRDCGDGAFVQHGAPFRGSLATHVPPKVKGRRFKSLPPWSHAGEPYRWRDGCMSRRATAARALWNPPVVRCQARKRPQRAAARRPPGIIIARVREVQL